MDESFTPARGAVTGGSWKRVAKDVMAMTPMQARIESASAEFLVGRLAAIRVNTPAEWNALLIRMGLLIGPEPPDEPLPPPPRLSGAWGQCGHRSTKPRPKVLTPKVVAAALGVSTTSIRNWIINGTYREGEHFDRVGSHVRFRADVVLERAEKFAL